MKRNEGESTGHRTSTHPGPSPDAGDRDRYGQTSVFSTGGSGHWLRTRQVRPRRGYTASIPGLRGQLRLQGRRRRTGHELASHTALGGPGGPPLGAPRRGQANDDAWCLDTGKRPKWFTDDDLFASGVAPNDDSYRSSGFDRGHMAMKLLVERLGQEAAYCTQTVLNAIPQRARFNGRVSTGLIELLFVRKRTKRRAVAAASPEPH